MNRAVTLLAACTVVAASHTPAVATGGAGLTCSMSATRLRDSNVVNAVISGGPWQAFTTRTDVAVSMRCTVRTWDGATLADVTAYGSAGFVLLSPTPSSFVVDGNASPSLYLCTEISVYDPGASPPMRYHPHDADNDPSNGVQCERSEPQENEVVFVYSEPPQQMTAGESCLFVEHGVGPTYLPPPVGDVPAPPDAVCYG